MNFDDDQDEFLSAIKQIDDAAAAATLTLSLAAESSASTNPPTATHLECLQKWFGHQQFRPKQWQIIRSIIDDKADNCAIMSTGYGKSLCYQFPAVFLGGITVVISPLISLMQDQVMALHKANITACFLGSAQFDQQMAAEATSGRYRIVYICPEYLTMHPDYLHKFNSRKLVLIAIDEVHCVSQWGHDFRVSYAKLGTIRKQMPNVPILAVTATATRLVRLDICKSLHLRRPHLVATDFDRPNLEFIVKRQTTNHWTDLEPIVRDTSVDGCIIIYCLSRSKTDSIARALTFCGLVCRSYHAGMTLDGRKRVLEEFVGGSVKIIVATLAFGMGIDKPDVRYVVHYGTPKDMEGYYQEVGRAGRDGLPAKCVLFYDESDFQTHEYFRGLSKGSHEVKRKITERSLLMRKYVWSTRVCRRMQILEYFDDPKSKSCEPKLNCCDNCRRLITSTKFVSFKNVLCLIPRGRYDINISEQKIILHATHEHEIIIGNQVRRIFLSHQNQREVYLVLSLNSPIQKGQSVYDNVVFLFHSERCVQIKKPYYCKFDTNSNNEYMSGPMYDIMTKLIIAASKNRLSVCSAKSTAISCSFKTTTGLLYTLDNEFFYIPSPPIQIHFDGILSVKFCRCGSLTKYFDFEIMLVMNPMKYTFQSIDKQYYDQLFGFISSKNIEVVTNEVNSNLVSTQPIRCLEPDYYLSRLQSEANERNSSSESNSETDSFIVESDENYFTVPESSSDDSNEESEYNSQTKTPSTAYLIWLDDTMKKMKLSNPDVTYTEISKSIGKAWRIQNKVTYQKKALMDQKQYKQQKALAQKSCKKFKRILDSSSSSDSDDVLYNSLESKEKTTDKQSSSKKRRTV